MTSHTPRPERWPERRAEPPETAPPPDWDQILGQAFDGALDGGLSDAPSLERLLDDWSRPDR